MTWTAAFAAALAAACASAIDGPGVTAIPNSTWGGALDPLPYVVRLEFEDHSYCTGTLIAPDLVATAGHCFATLFNSAWLGPNQTIPAGKVTINFGPGATTSTFTNSGGKTHNVIFQQPHDFALVSIDTSTAPVPVAPVPILPRAPKVGEQSVAAGFGVTELDQNKNNDQRKQVIVDGISQHNEAAKNFGEITIDGVTNHFIQQFQVSPEMWTETGDSGGPGLQIHLAIPNRAYGPNVGTLEQETFVFSGVSGGPTPSTFDSSDPTQITYPTDPDKNPDEWTRFDQEFEFIHDNRTPAMMPFQLSIFHNLPADPTTLVEEDEIKVFIRANYASTGVDYLLNVSLWEEDDQNAGPFTFSGDMALEASHNADDLAGIGFSAGRFDDGINSVVAWDETIAGDLVSFLEGELGGLDWLFQVNYGSAISMSDAAQNIDIIATDLATINQQIAFAMIDIEEGAAMRGGFALARVPSTGTLILMLLGLLGLSLYRTLTGRSHGRSHNPLTQNRAATPGAKLLC